MFDVLKDITKAAVGVATSPIDMAADAVTLGGALTDQDKPYTAQKAEKIMDNLNSACDSDR